MAMKGKKSDSEYGVKCIKEKTYRNWIAIKLRTA